MKTILELENTEQAQLLEEMIRFIDNRKGVKRQIYKLFQYNYAMPFETFEKVIQQIKHKIFELHN